MGPDLCPRERHLLAKKSSKFWTAKEVMLGAADNNKRVLKSSGLQPTQQRIRLFLPSGESYPPAYYM
ncbi:unnamed protein product [Musa textilis]